MSKTAAGKRKVILYFLPRNMQKSEAVKVKLKANTLEKRKHLILQKDPKRA